MEIQQPYLLFLDDAPDDLAAKTADDLVKRGVEAFAQRYGARARDHGRLHGRDFPGHGPGHCNR